MRTKTGCFNGAPEPKEVEVWDLYHALQWIVELGIQNVEYELDCKIVVEALSSKSIGTYYFHVILSFIFIKLTSEFC